MNKQQLASKIWESANKMRSKIEANEYKRFICFLEKLIPLSPFINVSWKSCKTSKNPVLKRCLYKNKRCNLSATKRWTYRRLLFG